MIKFTLPLIALILITINLSGQERFRTDTVEAYIGTMVIEESINHAGHVTRDTIITYQCLGRKPSRHSFLLMKRGNILIDTWDLGELKLMLKYQGILDEEVKFKSKDVTGKEMTVFIDFVTRRITYVYDDDLKKLVYY